MLKLLYNLVDCFLVGEVYIVVDLVDSTYGDIGARPKQQLFDKVHIINKTQHKIWVEIACRRRRQLILADIVDIFPAIITVY